MMANRLFEWNAVSRHNQIAEGMKTSNHVMFMCELILQTGSLLEFVIAMDHVQNSHTYLNVKLLKPAKNC